MSEKNALRIYTSHTPPDCEVHGDRKWPLRRGAFRKQKIRPNRRDRPDSQRHRIVRAKPGHTERLLRNSALACALLLGVLTLTNIDQPWARKASKGIEQALTMQIDLDDTIGELTFVKELMPESAVVFLNISDRNQLERPIDGSCSHPWSELQPWLMFACPADTAVCAVENGTVTAVSPLSDGLTGILVDHGGGCESVYALLASSEVKNGDTVERGQRIGTSGDNLYFEWRVNGASSDPTEAMGL